MKGNRRPLDLLRSLRMTINFSLDQSMRLALAMKIHSIRELIKTIRNALCSSAFIYDLRQRLPLARSTPLDWRKVKSPDYSMATKERLWQNKNSSRAAAAPLQE